jgi:hypothetical protein
MDSCPRVWNLLHDAKIVGIAGTVPGALDLELEIDYLRTRFAEPGNRLRLSLQDCREFVFRDWNAAKGVTSDLTTIAEKRLWVLSAEQSDEHCIVHCSEYSVAGTQGGTLTIAAGQTRLALDSGRIISFDELDAVSTAYWTEWEADAGRKR